METIKKLKDYIDLIRRAHPEIKDEELYQNGAIIYANGNDGTDFDWRCNNRLCEFMIYFREDGPKNGVGFIKVFIEKNDVMTAYVYADGGMHPTEKPVPFRLSNGEAARLAALMYTAADQEKLWDQDIDSLDLSVEPPSSVVDMFLYDYYEEDEKE